MLRIPSLVAAAAGILVTLAACNRSSPEPSEEAGRTTRSSAAPPKRTAPDLRPRIVAFGDSLTAGGEGSYPWFLQRDLDRAGYSWHVINEGVSGDTTTNGLMRVASVLAHKPEIVVLELGGNDGLRGVPVAATRANLEKILDALLADRKVTVVLAGITLPPNYGAEYIRPFEQMYRDLARQYRLPFLPFLLEGVALVPGMMSEDGIHPTVEGNQRVAANVFRVLKPLLEERRTPASMPR